ncbi:MAG: aspartate dehydrogenase [Lachnospiraceae bacterium]|nr:aspartate dehydrogenase [Lachnospiraceae bacterium]
MFGKHFDKKNARSEKQTFDPAVYKPVLKCSICNGEQVAGFKNRKTGKFEEIMFIRNESELRDFLARYGLDAIEKEY